MSPLVTKNPISAEQALAQLRAMATKGVPNCINLDAIDRILAHVQPDAAHLRAEALQLQVDGYQEWGTDVKRLTKELDQALFGDDAAEQASLCDLVSPARDMAGDLKATTAIVKGLAEWARRYPSAAYDSASTPVREMHALKEAAKKLLPAA